MQGYVEATPVGVVEADSDAVLLVAPEGGGGSYPVYRLESGGELVGVYVDLRGEPVFDQDPPDPL